MTRAGRIGPRRMDGVPSVWGIATETGSLSSGTDTWGPVVGPAAAWTGHKLPLPAGTRGALSRSQFLRRRWEVRRCPGWGGRVPVCTGAVRVGFKCRKPREWVRVRSWLGPGHLQFLPTDWVTSPTPLCRKSSRSGTGALPRGPQAPAVSCSASSRGTRTDGPEKQAGGRAEGSDPEAGTSPELRSCFCLALCALRQRSRHFCVLRSLGGAPCSPHPGRSDWWPEEQPGARVRVTVCHHQSSLPTSSLPLQEASPETSAHVCRLPSLTPTSNASMTPPVFLSGVHIH